MSKNSNITDYLLKRQTELRLSDYEMAERGNMTLAQWKLFAEGKSSVELEGGPMSQKLAKACGITTEQLLKNVKKQW